MVTGVCSSGLVLCSRGSIHKTIIQRYQRSINLKYRWGISQCVTMVTDVHVCSSGLYSAPEEVSTKPLSGDTRGPWSEIQIKNWSECNHGYRCMWLWTGTLFQRKYPHNHCPDIPEVHSLKYRWGTSQCVTMVTGICSSGLVLCSRGSIHKTIVWRYQRSTAWNTDEKPVSV